MKNAIFTLSIGEQDKCMPCMLSIQSYANKYGIPYFVADDYEINFVCGYLEKFQCFKLFDAGFERVLILDRDILITPHAGNIFECCPKTDTLYAFDENLPTVWMDRDRLVGAIKGEIDWPRNERGKYRYFNVGVVLLSSDFKDSIKDYRSVPDSEAMWIYPEQNCMNYLCFKNGVKFEPLDYTWNRLDLGLSDGSNKRYEADFIHYAGPCKYGAGQDKYETMRGDFIHFYGESVLKRYEQAKQLDVNRVSLLPRCAQFFSKSDLR